ncbi:MAG: reverse transcriptase domain-containing protein [Acidobacteriota bacterium]|nr:reverse transcriptase domain-containing protein [Acidobacteriota bacterium]
MGHEDLYSQIHSWPSLLRAWRKARRGKRNLPAAASFELTAPESLLVLQAELAAKSYQPGPYHSFFIHDPKKRLISAACFRDRIVHHALVNLLEPIFERRFIIDSYANRKGRGNHAAIDRCQEFARRYRFVLQADVEQFFPAVDHQILLQTLERVVRDRDVIELCRQILDSGKRIHRDSYRMRFFPGDDLFAVNRPRGLPIGNLTSQFWANVYLDPLDHFIKRRLRCGGYVRFVDDLLLFADDKRTLGRWRRELIAKAAGLRLTLHETRCQTRPVTEGIPFLGFVVYPHHKRLKRRKGIAYRRRLKKLLGAYQLGRIGRIELRSSIRGWVNHAAFGNTYGLRRRLFEQHPIRPPRDPRE